MLDVVPDGAIVLSIVTIRSVNPIALSRFVLSVQVSYICACG